MTAESDQFVVDGISPSRVETPTSVEELSAIVTAAHGAGEGIIPSGGRTAMSLGNPPVRYDVAVDLTHLNNFVEYEPADLTVVVEAGLTIQALQDELDKHGQWLPFDPAFAQRATIGGVLATNAVSTIRGSVGGVRDLTLGLKVVEADGSITKSGGRVVKNVQGFDLVRLHTGALGTLGIIVEAAFKVAPKPAAHRAVLSWVDSISTARSVGMRLFNGSFMPQRLTVHTGSTAQAAVELLSGQSPAASEAFLVEVHLAGGVRTVDRQVDEVTGLLGSEMVDGYDVIHNPEELPGQLALDALDSAGNVATRATFKPVAAFDFAEKTAGRAESVASQLHVATGTVLSAWDVESVESFAQLTGEIRAVAHNAGTRVVIDRCPREFKNGIDVWDGAAQELEISRRMKEQFDPLGTLNPGRFVAGI
ncbi:MAG: FAD-binding oxidoreductase [Chloroflexi bacterium]|nr:FAD-binding oxidoreductase [Chloroflexota bacterium]